jgi:hypothetical protein
MKYRAYLGAVVLAMLAIALVGCGGGGGSTHSGITPIPTTTLKQPDHSQEVITTTEAIAAAKPSAPFSASDEAKTELGKLQSSGPLSDAQMRSSLADFTTLANAKPGDVAAQTGLSILLAAVGVVNAAHVLRVDLPPDFYVPVAPSKIAAKSLKVSAASSRALDLATEPLQLVPRSAPKSKSSAVRAKALVPGQTYSTQELQSVLADLVLPCLALAIERLDYLASAVPDATVLVTYNDEDGNAWHLYRHDLRALAAGLKVVYSVGLIVNAYSWDWGSYSFDRQPYDMDTNHDGVLTVAEYAPASPFLTLLPDGAANLSTARTMVISAGETAYDLMGSKPTDLHSPLGKALEDADATNLDNARKDILNATDLFKNQVNVTAEYAWYDSAHDTFINHKTISVPVNLARLFTNPVSDLKRLFPAAYIVPDTEWCYPYEIQIHASGGGTSTETVGLMVDGGHAQLLLGPSSEPINTTNTLADIQARRVTFTNYDGAGHNLTVNWSIDCRRIWGSSTDGSTFDTLSFHDDAVQGGDYRQIITMPDAFPDHTLGGLFPNPDTFWADLVAKQDSPDILLLRYGHIETNLSDPWAWSKWSGS